MGKTVQIISDGSCDLPGKLASMKGVDVIPFYVSFDGENYAKEGVDIPVRDFYQKMVDEPNTFPKSSLPAIDDFYQAFQKYVKDQISVICICITTKFSGSMQAANTAKDLILEEYPDAKIEVIDSTINTVLQGLYVLEACKLRDKGMEFEAMVKRLLEIRESGRIFFTIGNIDYLKHGGRIGKLMGLAGSALKIKPLITLKQGEIFSSGISRSRDKSLQKVLDLLKEYLDERKGKCEKYSLAIGYGYDYDEAVRFRDMILPFLKEKLGVCEVSIYQIGATIGVHTGPYPLGIGIISCTD